MPLSGNKGEWSEIYIFLKLLHDGKIYAADKDMNRLATVYLNILKILREENTGQLYEYKTGDPVKIYLNGAEVRPDVSKADIDVKKNELWHLFETAPAGNITSASVEAFLMNSLHISKLKAPPTATGNFFGGTEDIILQVSDYRTSIISNVGFSCKSEFAHKATLFNASKDNTNFRFELLNMNDTIMNTVNGLFIPKRKKDGTIKYDIAVADRIKELKKSGVEIKFINQLVDNAARNIVLSGGMEMPRVIAYILQYYYWENNGESAHSSFSEAIDYLVEKNPAEYGFSDIRSIYRAKVGKLLYDMFTGMRLSRTWDGRSNVTGGYIIAKNDGDVLAYHTTLADEFKDFLVEKLGLETPSSSRHNAMQVYKESGHYFINFNLQVRFKG